MRGLAIALALIGIATSAMAQDALVLDPASGLAPPVATPDHVTRLTVVPGTGVNWTDVAFPERADHVHILGAGEEGLDPELMTRLSGLHGVQRVTLEEVIIPDLDFLEAWHGLRHVTLTAAAVDDPSALSAVPHLAEVDVILSVLGCCLEDVLAAPVKTLRMDRATYLSPEVRAVVDAWLTGQTPSGVDRTLTLGGDF